MCIYIYTYIYAYIDIYMYTCIMQSIRNPSALYVYVYNVTDPYV